MNLIPGQEHEGMIYVGTLLNENNEPYALLVEKEDRGEMNWHDAMKTEALPTSEELNLMRSNHKLLNMTDWYWSSTEYGNTVSWIQRFSDGFQTGNVKGNLYRVRCVRRLTLQSFDYLKGEKMNYPLIKKWLGLDIEFFYGKNGADAYVNANDLENKLGQGEQLYGLKDDADEGDWVWSNIKDHNIDTHSGLLISKYSIKKQTQAEAALEYLRNLAKYAEENNLIHECEYKKAKQILEMKEE